MLISQFQFTNRQGNLWVLYGLATDRSFFACVWSLPYSKNLHETLEGTSGTLTQNPYTFSGISRSHSFDGSNDRGTIGSENCDFHIYEREFNNNHPSSNGQQDCPFLSSEHGATS